MLRKPSLGCLLIAPHCYVSAVWFWGKEALQLDRNQLASHSFPVQDNAQCI